MSEKKKTTVRRPKYKATDFLEIYNKLPYDYRQVLSRAMLNMKGTDPKYNSRLIYVFIKHRISQKYRSQLAFCNEVSDDIKRRNFTGNPEYDDKNTLDAVRSTLRRETDIDGYYYEEIINYLGITAKEIKALFNLELATDTDKPFFFEALSPQNKILIYQIANELLRLIEFPDLYNTEDDEYNYDAVEYIDSQDKDHSN